MESGTCQIYEGISGAKNKAADCLSHLVELPTSTVTTANMLTVTHTDRPAFNTRSCTQKNSPDTVSTPHPDVSPTDFSRGNFNIKTTYGGQVRSITANVKNRPVL